MSPGEFWLVIGIIFLIIILVILILSLSVFLFTSPNTNRISCCKTKIRRLPDVMIPDTIIPEARLVIYDKPFWYGFPHTHTTTNEWIAIPEGGSFIFWSDVIGKFKLIVSVRVDDCNPREIKPSIQGCSEFFALPIADSSFNIQIQDPNSTKFINCNELPDMIKSVLEN